MAAAIPGSTLLLDRAATEERIKSEPLDSYEVLHFSVHVSVDAEHPDRTGLILADGPGSTEDGLLQAREIAHLRLRAKLVVLSGAIPEARSFRVPSIMRAWSDRFCSRERKALWRRYGPSMTRLPLT